MCRSRTTTTTTTTDNHDFYYQNQKRDGLKIKAFYVRLLLSNSTSKTVFPQTITLHYLPRISGSPLEINDFKIRSNLDAFLTLHRVTSAEKSTNELVFASRECVRVSEAVRFQLYFEQRQDIVLKGIFRKDKQEHYWKLALKATAAAADVINEAEVSVAAEGHVAIIDKVDMKRTKNKCTTSGRCFNFIKGTGFLLPLDDIPEEIEEGDFYDNYNYNYNDKQMEIGEEDDFTVRLLAGEEEIISERMRFAVDVGIWVMCFGVGLLVSKASSKRFTRRFISS